MLFIPDYSVGQVNLDAVSDQTLMEMLIEHLEPASIRQFKESTTEFKDVCKWSGVKCDKRRRVTIIKWSDKTFEIGPLRGIIDLRLLPPHTREIRLTTFVRSNAYTLSGPCDAGALPKNLESLLIGDHNFSGKFEFQRLPPNILHVTIHNCRFHGSLHTIGLPRNLILIHVDHNSLPGSLSLTNLPQKLQSIFGMKCQFHGSLCLSNLPKVMRKLFVPQNAFSGSIDLDSLPPNLKQLVINNNALSGSFIFRNVPYLMEKLQASNNNFEGTAFVAERARFVADISNNKVVRVLDEHGHPYRLQNSDNGGSVDH